MLWVILGSVAVMIAAGCSVAATRDSHRDIKSGKPTFHSVADVTGVWDRAKLDQLIGPRDGNDRYAVRADQVYDIPQTWWKRWLDNDFCDVSCVVLAVAVPCIFLWQPTLAIVLLAGSAAYVIIGYTTALVVVLRGN